MIRNVLLFLAGVVVALAVVYMVERKMVQNDPGEISLLSDLGAVDLRLGGLGGGGSGIRVVGGSLTAHISQTYHWPSEPQTTNQLMLENADAWTFSIENFSLKPNGNQLTPLGYPHLSDTWTIIELVNDPMDNNRGIKITGSSGNTPRSGTVTFVPINGDDYFIKVASRSGKNGEYLYHNQHCSVSATTGKTCTSEKLREIQVYIGGSATPDLWYCDPTVGQCHVDIGTTQ
jgi:hypothetical protein